MTREETVRWVGRRLEAMNRHASNLADLYASDCVVESPTTGRIVQGLTAVEELARAWAGSFPDLTFTTDELIIESDCVAWIATAAGTDTGGFLGLPATGKPFAVPMVFLSRLHDGRIAHERRIFDFTHMLLQLGLLKARATTPMPTGMHVDPPSSQRGADVAGRSTPDQIRALLERRSEAWARRDTRALAEQHSEDCVMDSHLAGRLDGRAAIAAVYDRWFTAFPDSRFAPEDAVIDRGRVAEIATMTGTDTGGFLGLPPTRRPFRLPSVWLYTIRDLQLAHVRPIYDFTGMLVQIGVLKAKPA
jgi:steroid delta-isomerase-like uncharacterized protein